MHRLVNENLRNFQVPQEGLTVSRVMRGLFTISRHKVFSQDHHSRSGVQATLLCILKLCITKNYKIMSTFMAILAVLLPIAACVFIPIWMKKKGKGKNAFVRILVGLLFAIMLLLVFSGLSSALMTDEEREEQRVEDSIRIADKQRKQFIKDSVEIELKAEAKRQADSIFAERNKPLKSEWIERSNTDEMTDATNVWMTLTSDNYYEFDFPYDGGTRLKIEVRYRKQDGNQVILSVNRGQLMESTSYQRNEVVVRFDDDEPMRFTTSEPADYSSNMLFLNNPRKFINRAKTAKKILVQVPTYNNGQPTFTFEPAEPLKWEY